MKKSYVSRLSLILVCVMILGSLAACVNSGSPISSETTAAETDGEKTTTGDSMGDETEPPTVSESESVSETETEEDTTPKLDYMENGDLIEYADRIANDVVVKNEGSEKNALIMENRNSSLVYKLRGSESQLVTALKNKNGLSYIENTMDVFVKTKSGNTYYASESLIDTATNVYRLGYYYYDVRLENQDFAPAPVVVSEKEIPFEFKSYKHLTPPKEKKGELMTAVRGGNDPYMVLNNISYSAEQYAYLQLTLKVESNESETLDVYYITDLMKTYTDLHKVTVELIADGEYHTYNICLGTALDYSGNVSSLRIDFSGEEGTLYPFNSIKLIESANSGDIPNLRLGRFFQVYSDKLHHYAQFCATALESDIEAVGMITEVDASRVQALVIKDKDGVHNTLDDVDFDSVEYVAFDVIDTGIFGYILPTGEYGGKLSVETDNGAYSIIQTLTPPDNTIIPSENGTNNANDFYIGQRIYTDESHDFTAFLNEAECERHPLTAENIMIDDEKSSNATFSGYDALRGKYVFVINGSDFNTAFYRTPNKHYTVDFTVIGDEYDRKTYFSTYTTSGSLECAVLLDGKEMLLPVPVEVCKNFLGDGENNLYNRDEPPYGEAYVPIILNAGETREYTIVNLYQNWGNFPLKQISSIQYFYPYYHLSTGTTESNCIIPYAFEGPHLPDHRAMSAPLWPDQPQHTLGGHHRFIRYTDSEGVYAGSQSVKHTITSHGPTYAEVQMDYLTDDERIAVSYTHMEMPQTDENRTYYVMEYKVLEDVSFKDFKKDFLFYSVKQTGTGSTYKKVGYLDQNNQPQIVDAMADDAEASYILGDEYPYFDFFYVPDYTNKNGYVNLAFLLADYSFVIGGKECDADFILTNKDEHLYLSLNLDQVTLKKGDSFTLHAILMPWGSQESIYDGSDGKAPDQNVRDVRENSIIDPFKVEPVRNCAVVESIFLPKVATTNMRNAVFKLSGGENNAVVRVYGFRTLTVPFVEEQIDGEWVEYDLSSKASPDSEGNYNFYDGYMAHYDGDGTFSYSFVISLNGDQERTFRVTSTDRFESWPEKKELFPEEEDPINVYTSPNEMKSKLDGAKGVGKAEIVEEDESRFVRIYGDNETGEGNAVFYNTDKKKETGSLVVIKYRIPKENAQKIGCFEIFTSTVNPGATAGDQIYYYSLKQDGFWHVMVIDVTKEKHPTFKADGDGSYYAKYLRLDFFSGKMSESSYIDLAYVGICATMDEVYSINQDMNTVTLVTQGTHESYFDVKTGEQVEESGDGKLPHINYVDPESGYTESTVKYAACIDMLNGWGIGDSKRFSNIGASSIKEPDVLDYGVTTVNGYQLIFTGWCVADGGISKYVWSADGGKTWNDAIPTSGKINDGNDEHIKTASSRLGGYTFADPAATRKNVTFQGTVGGGAKVNGLVADLSAYAGQNLEVTFGLVPAAAADTICVAVHVKNVQVAD